MKAIFLILLIAVLVISGCIEKQTGARYIEAIPQPVPTSEIRYVTPNQTPTSDPAPTSTPITEPTSKYEYLIEQKGDLRWYDVEGECELAAKTYQKEYGGDLVFVAPYDTRDNSFIKGAYSGTWINLVHKNGKDIYVDYINQRIFMEKDEVVTVYNNQMKKKFSSSYVNVKLFIYGVDSMPYPMIWHY